MSTTEKPDYPEEPENGGCKNKDCPGLLALAELVVGLESKLGVCSKDISSLKTTLHEISAKIDEAGKLNREAIRARTSFWSGAFDFAKVAIRSPALIILSLVALAIAIPSGVAISISWTNGIVVGAPEVIRAIEANGKEVTPATKTEPEPTEENPA